MVVVTAGPAAAHTELVRTEPADGLTVGEAPQEVRFTFTGAIQDLFVASEVKDPDNRNLADGPPVITDNVLTQKVTVSTKPGRYIVTMRVVAVDGHPVSRQVTFTVTPGAPPPPPLQPLTPASGGDSAAGPPDGQNGQNGQNGDGGGVPWLPIGLVVLAVLTAGGLLAWQERQRAS